jgi:hypothetical protein
MPAANRNAEDLALQCVAGQWKAGSIGKEADPVSLADKGMLASSRSAAIQRRTSMELAVHEQPAPSLAERLAYGNLTVKETRLLKNRSHSGFYEDLRCGLVAELMSGRRSRKVVPLR